MPHLNLIRLGKLWKAQKTSDYNHFTGKHGLLLSCSLKNNYQTYKKQTVIFIIYLSYIGVK